jgi:uncharacterized protein YqhQ
VTNTSTNDLYVGGQALIEGVMMRGPSRWAAAARTPDGGIETVDGPVPTWARVVDPVPVVRGAVAMVETILVGLRSLRWSAAVSSGEDEEETSSTALAFTTIVTLALFTAVFAVVPAAIARAVPGDSQLVFGLVEGSARLGLFLAYVVAIGRSPAIRRTFQYHGAEHMTIAAYEHGDPLTTASVRTHSTRHARCGTDFLLLVVVVAIVVFTAVGDAAWPVLVATRVIGLPIVAGLAYEALRAAKRHPDSALVALIVRPGLALQALTTREPEHDQIEVAIEALEAVLTAEGGSLSTTPAEPQLASHAPPSG